MVSYLESVILPSGRPTQSKSTLSFHGNPSGLTHCSSHYGFPIAVGQAERCVSVVKIVLLTKLYVEYVPGVL